MLFILALLAFFAIALPDAMLGVAWPFMRVTFDQRLAAMTLDSVCAIVKVSWRGRP